MTAHGAKRTLDKLEMLAKCGMRISTIHPLSAEQTFLWPADLDDLPD
jgi:hypothetical protein